MDIFSKIPNLRGKISKVFCKNPDSFLTKAKGIIHVGANEGQERDEYAKHGLNVIWIEPIPEVFDILKENIKGYVNQRAYQALITDKDGAEYTFHIANNQGASSSIFDLKLHKEIWPEVNFKKSIKLKSITLTTLIRQENIDLSNYDSLVIDTQGAELLVLKGAEGILPVFKFIKAELPDFEAYEGCSKLSEVTAFLENHGFEESIRSKFAEHPNGGAYYDVLYVKKQTTL